MNDDIMSDSSEFRFMVMREPVRILVDSTRCSLYSATTVEGAANDLSSPGEHLPPEERTGYMMTTQVYTRSPSSQGRKERP
mmetsp:Transcript_37407/g.47697  ORF Transcript_37407/g.47697 Transcript_37407/m.47697 type:complete len:81 (+) Transcript_37407:50-292(+)